MRKKAHQLHWKVHHPQLPILPMLCLKRSRSASGLSCIQTPALVIGSYDREGKPNIMTAAWIGISNSNPLSTAVSMRPATYSYDNLTENASFSPSISPIGYGEIC